MELQKEIEEKKKGMEETKGNLLRELKYWNQRL